MHERSLVQALLEQVEDLMRENEAQAVTRIQISVGQFSGVEAELLRFAFDDMVQSSRICGAQLVIEQVPLEGACKQCAHVFAIQRFEFACPQCGHRDIEIARGEELILESVTLEQAEYTHPDN